MWILHDSVTKKFHRLWSLTRGLMRRCGYLQTLYIGITAFDHRLQRRKCILRFVCRELHSRESTARAGIIGMRRQKLLENNYGLVGLFQPKQARAVLLECAGLCADELFTFVKFANCLRAVRFLVRESAQHGMTCLITGTQLRNAAQ